MDISYQTKIGQIGKDDKKIKQIIRNSIEKIGIVSHLDYSFKDLQRGGYKLRKDYAFHKTSAQFSQFKD